MSPNTLRSTRRAALKVVGAGAGVAVAGCTGDGSSGDGSDGGGDTGTPNPGGSSGSTETATATAHGSNPDGGSLLRVRGYRDGTEYIVVTDDTNATKGSRADEGDTVETSEQTLRFYGSTDANQVDTYQYDGSLENLSVECGHASFVVDGDLGERDLIGSLDVEGSGLYYVVATGDIRAVKDTEKDEENVQGSVATGTVTGGVDRFEVEGELVHVMLRTKCDARLVLRHSYAKK